MILNWKANGYASKQEALANAIGMVMKYVPNSTLIWQGELFQSAVKTLTKNVQKPLPPNLAR